MISILKRPRLKRTYHNQRQVTITRLPTTRIPQLQMTVQTMIRDFKVETGEGHDVIKLSTRPQTDPQTNTGDILENSISGITHDASGAVGDSKDLPHSESEEKERSRKKKSVKKDKTKPHPKKEEVTKSEASDDKTDVVDKDSSDNVVSGKFWIIS
jgi:hypothetical protein